MDAELFNRWRYKMSEINKTLLIFCFTLLLCQCRSKGNHIKEENESVQNGFIIVGTWEIVDYRAGSIAGISNEEALMYIGKRLVLGVDSVKLIDGEVMRDPIYRIRIANAEEYLHFNYRFPPSGLGIKAKEIEVLELYESGYNVDIEKEDPYYELVLHKGEYLIDFWEGYFFFLKRIEDH